MSELEKWTTCGAVVSRGKLREYIALTGPSGKRTRKTRASSVEYDEKWGKRSKDQAKAAATAKASAWMDEENEKLDELAAMPESALTWRQRPVSELAEQFIREREAIPKKDGGIEGSTALDYRNSLKRFGKLGDCPVGELNKQKIKAWLAQLNASGLSGSPRLKAFRLLSQVLKYAVSEEIIPANPCAGIKAPSPEKKDKGNNYLREDQRARVLEALDGMGIRPTAVAVRIALYTGMREGEICALRWRDFEHSNMFDPVTGEPVEFYSFHVRNAIGREKGRAYEKPPKNGRERVVAVPTELAEFLVGYRDQLRRNCMPCDFDDYMLPNINSNRAADFTNPSLVSREWKLLAEAMGFVGSEGRVVKFHELRHTWATMAAAAGIDPVTASSNLGHDPSIYYKTYAAVDPTAQRRLAVAIGGTMLPKAGEVIPFKSVAVE